LQAYSAELGDVISEPDRALVAQAAGLQLTIERLQSDDLAGKDVDRDQIIRLASELRRTTAALKGRADKAKPAHQDALAAHVQSRYGVAHDEAESDDAEDMAAVG
jgi:hypothetical protein